MKKQIKVLPHLALNSCKNISFIVDETCQDTFCSLPDPSQESLAHPMEISNFKKKSGTIILQILYLFIFLTHYYGSLQ